MFTRSKAGTLMIPPIKVANTWQGPKDSLKGPTFHKRLTLYQA